MNVTTYTLSEHPLSLRIEFDAGFEYIFYGAQHIDWAGEAFIDIEAGDYVPRCWVPGEKATSVQHFREGVEFNFAFDQIGGPFFTSGPNGKERVRALRRSVHPDTRYRHHGRRPNTEMVADYASLELEVAQKIHHEKMKEMQFLLRKGFFPADKALSDLGHSAAGVAEVMNKTAEIMKQEARRMDNCFNPPWGNRPWRAPTNRLLDRLDKDHEATRQYVNKQEAVRAEVANLRDDFDNLPDADPTPFKTWA
jgi:hypothetical protein